MGRGIFTTLRDLSGPALARYIWPNAGRPGRKCINADGMQDRVAATTLHRGIHFPPGLLALGKMVLWEREAGGGPPHTQCPRPISFPVLADASGCMTVDQGKD